MNMPSVGDLYNHKSDDLSFYYLITESFCGSLWMGLCLNDGKRYTVYPIIHGWSKVA